MTKILIIGSSSFIGHALYKGLKNAEIHFYKGRSIYGKSPAEMAKDFQGKDIIINLAGKSLFNLWTPKVKKKIYESRIVTTRKLVAAILLMENQPRLLINASGIDVYEPEVEVDENSDIHNDNFLAQVVKDWENCLEPLKESSTKVCITRFGIVLGKEGGAYKILRTITKFNFGAYFGKGDQSLSFIYMGDLIRAIDLIIHEEITGIINIVAPETTDYKELMKHMKRKLKAFVIWSLPPGILRLMAGEASQMLLNGHIVRPGVLLKNNFNFEADNIESCINKLEDN